MFQSLLLCIGSSLLLCIGTIFGLCVIGVAIEVIRSVYHYGFWIAVEALITAAGDTTAAVTKYFDSNSNAKATVNNARVVPWSYATHKSTDNLVRLLKVAVNALNEAQRGSSIVHKADPIAPSDNVPPPEYHRKQCPQTRYYYFQNATGYVINADPKYVCHTGD